MGLIFGVGAILKNCEVTSLENNSHTSPSPLKKKKNNHKTKEQQATKTPEHPQSFLPGCFSAMVFIVVSQAAILDHTVGVRRRSWQ